MTTVSQNEEIQMIVASNGFSGKTGKDVGIGCSKADVVSRYGGPTRTLDTSLGYTLVYDVPGIAFNFQEGKLALVVLF